MALIRVADGAGSQSEVLALSRGIREQLALAEQWAITHGSPASGGAQAVK